MSFERQRAAALRMIKKNGTSGTKERTVLTPVEGKEWSSTETIESVPVYFVAFADDGITFVNHNVQGDTRLLTLVSERVLDVQVGDVISAKGRTYTVKLAKPLDPDLEGAILWAALVQ